VKIKIFTTGGSIDKGYSTRESSFIVRGSQIDEILKEANVSFEYEVEAILRKDSLDITEADCELIARKVEGDPSRYILITHGTDTMAETGRRLCHIQEETIVLTGAMQPASFKHSDAQFNIGFALAALQRLPPGVHIAVNGRIFDPTKVRKNIEMNRFEEAE
jgi:L-asparaginase